MSHISHKVNPQNILLVKKGNNWLLHFQLYGKLVKVEVVRGVWGKKSYKGKSYMMEKVGKDCKSERLYSKVPFLLHNLLFIYTGFTFV